MCSLAPQGITIDNLVPDTFDVTITGLDAAGNQLYGMGTPKSVTLAARFNTYAIDVPALTGDLTVDWGAFGTFTDCSASQANIPTVGVVLENRLDNVLDDKTWKCSDAGVAWSRIPAGTDTVIFSLEPAKPSQAPNLR